MPEPVVRKGALIFKGETKPAGIRNKPVFREPVASSETDVLPGQGRIVSNGLTIQGLETLFKDELEVGDAIMIKHPQTSLREERRVVSIVSQRSLSVDRPFSSDFVSTTEFRIQKHRPAQSQVTGLKTEMGVDLPDNENTSTLTYQGKIGPWSRQTVTEMLDKHVTEEELLDMRCKKVHDKYCSI